MITCKCGKTIDKLPSWMEGIQVEFVCNNCPNRQTKNIAFVTFETEVPKVAKPDDELEDEVILDDVEEPAEVV
jgi:hypothetical protein